MVAESCSESDHVSGQFSVQIKEAIGLVYVPMYERSMAFELNDFQDKYLTN